MSQEILRPLLAAALYTATTIAPHLVTLPPQVQQRRLEDAQLSEAAPDPGLIKEALRRHARDGEPLEAVRDATARARLQPGMEPRRPAPERQPHRAGPRGGSPQDPPGRSCRPPAADRAGRRGRRRRQALGPPRRARPRSPATREPAPWTLPLDERGIRDLTGYAHTACLLLTAALTGMRESELMELRHGCRSISRHGDGMTRCRLEEQARQGTAARRHQRGMGRHRGRLRRRRHGRAAQPPHQRSPETWYSAGSTSTSATAGSGTGSTAPQASASASPRSRTAPSPCGCCAAPWPASWPTGPAGCSPPSSHSSTSSVATTEGYAARPGGAQGKLLAEIAEDEADRNLQIVLAEFRSYQDGIMPAGPGARELTAFFAAVDADLAGHETAAAPRRRQRPARPEPAQQARPGAAPRRGELLLVHRPVPGALPEAGRNPRRRASRWPECATRPAARRPPTTPATGPSGQTPSPAPPRSSARSAAPGQPSEPASRPNSTAPSASWTPSTPRPPRQEGGGDADHALNSAARPSSGSGPPPTRLLRGDIPPDGKCDVTTLARQAGVSRAALYRTYPHLKEEFERRLAALHAGGTAPDPARRPDHPAQGTQRRTQAAARRP